MMESLDDERKRKVESTEAASDSAKRSNAVYSSFFSQGMMVSRLDLLIFCITCLKR